jgi:hypothetical protein
MPCGRCAAVKCDGPTTIDARCQTDRHCRSKSMNAIGSFEPSSSMHRALNLMPPIQLPIHRQALPSRSRSIAYDGLRTSN